MANDRNEVPKISAKIIKAMPQEVKKAGSSIQVGDNNSSTWLDPPVEFEGLKTLVKHSTILPQCIRAYKDNIAGFGIGIKYREDIDETREMAEEYTKAEAIIDQLNLDMDTKEVFEDLIEARETFGVAYLEVMRNVAGEVNQIEFVKDTETIRKSVCMDPAVPAPYSYKGEQILRPKKFSKYKQEKGGKVVYFKEFGDPRIMNKQNGNYEDAIELSNQANEILEFGIGTSNYGEVRWIGQVLNVDGSRRAENLNNNYFINGRHTPLMIVVKGGSLSDDSFDKLQQYINGIKGENGQHAFLLLEVEDNENKVGFDQDKQPSVEIKDMASILQKDELFQDYLDNSRKKVQSAFRLPDLYVGYTTDFNRATAQTAQEVTEQQVFMPERKSLAWTINNKLLNAYGFKYVEVYFKAPDIANPDDMAKILNITERAGGLTPNDAREITLKIMGKSSENYGGEWGDTPIAISRLNAATQMPSTDGIATQIDASIKKAVLEKDQDVVALLRAIQKEFIKRGADNG